MSASRALFDNCVNGNCVECVAFSLELSGKYTSLFDVPCFGKFISSGTKCDVAPESMTNLHLLRLSIRRVYLLDLLFISIGVEILGLHFLLCIAVGSNNS